MLGDKARFFAVLVILAYYVECYEPLNLKPPNMNDYEVPTETFTLCDMSKIVYQNYCQNNGICYSLYGKTSEKPAVTEEELANEIFCSCPFDFTGNRCETKTEITRTGLASSTIEEIFVSPQPTANDVSFLKQSSLVSQPDIKVVKETDETTTAAAAAAAAVVEEIANKTLQACPSGYNCQNGGTCVFDVESGPRCVCTAEFTGLDCSNAKHCEDMKNCSLVCEFGFERKENNCELCKCNCVNEVNYFDEVKRAFAMVTNGSETQANKFCQKTCKFGYLKDDQGCYKCDCIESSVVRMGTQSPATNASESLSTPGPRMGQDLTHDICTNIPCKPGEVCKYFDTNMYRCPDEKMDCLPYEQATKIPVCVPTSYNAPCLENIKIGSCSTYSERYYFDIIDKECKKFFYAGCGGNRNNFASLDECIGVCLRSAPVMHGGLVYQGNQVDSSLPKESFVYKRPPILFPRPAETTSQSTTTTTTTESSSSTTTPMTTTPEINVKLNELNTTDSGDDDTMECQWVCNLNCPFGYKMNYRTRCYQCECIDLNMTECGVPCFLQGTKNCLFSMRANSRPKCVCNPDYDGVYCHMYNQNFNFSVHSEQKLKLTSDLSDSIKKNLSKRLSKVLDIGTNHVVVHDIKNNLKNQVVIRFGVYAPDFTNSTYFYGLVETVQAMLNAKNLTLKVQDADLLFGQNCDNSEELFVMDLNENYFLKTEKLKQMIFDLKQEVTRSYRFLPDSISLVKIKVEPVIQIEFVVKNSAMDPDFCIKSYNLQNDIRSKAFTLSKYDAKFLELSDVDEKKLSNILWDASDESIFQARNRESGVGHLTTPSFLNHSVVFISVIIASFLVLLFLIGLVIITQLKRKQSKRISKISDTCSRLTIENFDKHSSNLARSTDFPGYFLPNYTASNHRSTAHNDSTGVQIQQVQKMNVPPY